MNIKISVSTGEPRPDVFIATIHRATSPAELQMDPKEFYEKFCGSIPQGAHHELELLTDLSTHPYQALIHTHWSARAGKRFVCWTGQLQTETQAISMFRIWCVGTAYTLKHGKDFGEEYVAHQTDFFEHMRQTFGIFIANEELL